jgi:OmpA-OmpF porin, OOP family
MRRLLIPPVRPALYALGVVAAMGLAACAHQAPPPPQTVVEAPPPPPPPPPAQPQPRRYILQADAMFDFDSSTLNDEGRRRIAEIANKIKGEDVRSVLVLGFTDRIGPQHYNWQLSRRRAEAARVALIEDGVPEDWIEAQGHGSDNPRVECTDAQSRADLISCLAPNRRVEVIARIVR